MLLWLVILLLVLWAAGSWAPSRKELATLERLERRAGFRDFVGSSVGPTVVLSHAKRREQTARRCREATWRTRALGKRPQPCASG